MAQKKGAAKGRGLEANMHQGAGRRGGGDAGMVGNTRGIMHNGGSTKRTNDADKKLGNIMGQ